jgi:hypothetical protein
MPKTVAAFYRPPTDEQVSFGGATEGCANLCIDDPAGTIGAGECSGGAVPGINLHEQAPVEIQIGFADLADDGVSLTRFHYEFHGDVGQKAVKLKWQWTESVDDQHGNATDGSVAMQVWYFDSTGRLRYHGRGGGNTESPPKPRTPFVVTYFEYDTNGRLAREIDGISPCNANTLDFSIPGVPAIPPVDRQHFVPIPADQNCATSAPLVTASTYNDAGTLTS